MTKLIFFAMYIRIPLKQGLRHTQASDISEISLYIRIPLKQGLRRDFFQIEHSFLDVYSYSIKTRIKTDNVIEYNNLFDVF